MGFGATKQASFASSLLSYTTMPRVVLDPLTLVLLRKAGFLKNGRLAAVLQPMAFREAANRAVPAPIAGSRADWTA